MFDGLFLLQEMKLTLKEESTAKEVAEEEAMRNEKKMQEYRLKVEELQKTDKVSVHTLSPSRGFSRGVLKDHLIVTRFFYCVSLKVFFPP